MNQGGTSFETFHLMEKLDKIEKMSLFSHMSYKIGTLEEGKPKQSNRYLLTGGSRRTGLLSLKTGLNNNNFDWLLSYTKSVKIPQLRLKLTGKWKTRRTVYEMEDCSLSQVTKRKYENM